VREAPEKKKGTTGGGTGNDRTTIQGKKEQGEKNRSGKRLKGEDPERG